MNIGVPVAWPGLAPAAVAALAADDRRIVIGPSILDRAVASDVLLTEVMCVWGAEMAINHHTRSLPLLLIIAAVGVFGSISIARFVARRDNTEQ